MIYSQLNQPYDLTMYVLMHALDKLLSACVTVGLFRSRSLQQRERVLSELVMKSDSFMTKIMVSVSLLLYIHCLLQTITTAHKHRHTHACTHTYTYARLLTCVPHMCVRALDWHL